MAVPGTQGEHVFVYGTLVDPAVLDGVLGHRHLGERLRARLPGYARQTSPDFAYPYIVPSPDAAVDGILVLDLSTADVEALDAYEDVGVGTYARRRVAVEAWGCGPHALRVEAHTYVAGAALARQAAAERAAGDGPAGSTPR